MPISQSARPLLGMGFILALAAANQTIDPVQPLTTEEGQKVVFDRVTWQYRELAKRIPPEQPFPSGKDLQEALSRLQLVDNTPPKAIPVPARIDEDLYLIGQDRVSNLTYMIDCGPEGVAIIDPTYESEFERTVANVEKCGRSKSDIKWVINTHCHVDHAMADYRFRELGARIVIQEQDADHVEKGTRVTAAYLVEKQTGKADFPPSKVDRRLSDGEVLKLGNKTLHVIHTPGHTPGSASFLLQIGPKNVLFAGDTVLYDGRLGWQGNPYADNQQYLASLRKLVKFTMGGPVVRWDILLPGHGAISMDRAYLDVEKARDIVAADVAAGREIQSSPYATPEYRKRMYGRPATPPR